MDYDMTTRFTLAILVNNKSGVLMRVVALFSRRGYNIDSLAVGETEDPATSRITIVVTGDRQIIGQIIRQVEKLVDVRNVFEMTNRGSLQRELVLIKLKADESTRSNITDIAEIFKAKIIDVTPVTLSMQITGSRDKLESFLTLVEPYGIVELVRTGVTALERGPRALSETTFGSEDEE